MFALRRVKQRLRPRRHRSVVCLELGSVEDVVDSDQLARKFQAIGHRPDAPQHFARPDKLREKFAGGARGNLEVL